MTVQTVLKMGKYENKVILIYARNARMLTKCSLPNIETVCESSPTQPQNTDTMQMEQMIMAKTNTQQQAQTNKTNTDNKTHTHR